MFDYIMMRQGDYVFGYVYPHMAFQESANSVVYGYVETEWSPAKAWHDLPETKHDDHKITFMYSYVFGDDEFHF